MYTDSSPDSYLSSFCLFEQNTDTDLLLFGITWTLCRISYTHTHTRRERLTRTQIQTNKQARKQTYTHKPSLRLITFRCQITLMNLTGRCHVDVMSVCHARVHVTPVSSREHKGHPSMNKWQGNIRWRQRTWQKSEVISVIVNHYRHQYHHFITSPASLHHQQPNHVFLNEHITLHYHKLRLHHHHHYHHHYHHQQQQRYQQVIISIMRL